MGMRIACWINTHSEYVTLIALPLQQWSHERAPTLRFVYMNIILQKSYCSTVHFRRITSIYQPTNAHIISHKTHLKRFKTLRHVSILSDHHQGALFLAKVILQYTVI